MTRSSQLLHPTPLPALLNIAIAQPATQTLFTRLFVALQRWRYHARMRRELLTLDERMLKDIGLTRADVETAVNAPFWRVWANPESRYLL